MFEFPRSTDGRTEAGGGGGGWTGSDAVIYRLWFSTSDSKRWIRAKIAGVARVKFSCNRHRMASKSNKYNVMSHKSQILVPYQYNVTWSHFDETLWAENCPIVYLLSKDALIKMRGNFELQLLLARHHHQTTEVRNWEGDFRLKSLKSSKFHGATNL